uniref:(northern house mosquito) hypothetical protein n=1 Tax=Culex pipiens TaxID=7175 RepID=A0A8D8IN47_CULPI
MFSSVVGGTGGTVEPGGDEVEGYSVEVVLFDCRDPNTPAVATWLPSANLRDSTGVGSSLKITPDAARMAIMITATRTASPRSQQSQFFFFLSRLSLVTYSFSPLINFRCSLTGTKYSS